ncbi:MAG: peptidoglycan-binding protein [Alphaproteobacteria bacterium]|nr:peptidoglycan-binding protein [Alphaproteobacteria bacterium]
MYSPKFEKAFAYVIENEGGYVFDKNDPGGETKFGISKRSYPSLNIKDLTLEDAKKIYYRDFWQKGKFEEIDDEKVATQVFDLSVNLGIRAAVSVLQRALRSVGINVQEDGLIGPQTLSAVSNSEPRCLLAAIKSEAAGYYRQIAAKNPSQQKFLKGWLNRAYRSILF